MPDELHKQVEQFVLANTGGVMLPVSIPKVCEMLMAWSALVGAQDPYVPNEWRCDKCNYRIASSQVAGPPCPIDGAQMVRVTWREAARDSAQAALQARKRTETLEEAWPAGFQMPVPEEEF